MATAAAPRRVGSTTSPASASSRLVQLDGSRHDWLEGRGPWLRLLGAIDDATGVVTGAKFREQEDVAGFLAVLRQTVRRHRIPTRRLPRSHTIFETSGGALTLEKQLVDRRTPTQVGRALEELRISSIAARSPQAKGRIERLWGTFQDRLVGELRLAGAADRETAERVLARHLVRHNRRFSVPAADPTSAWRPRPAGLRLDQVFCLKYRRVVANDHTVRAGDDPPAATRAGPSRLHRQARRGSPTPRQAPGGLGP